MKEIYVSIIIPIYNVEDYIVECLQSVYNQTFKEYEVILVDDGSADSSIELVNNYIKDKKCFSLVRQENGGLSAARNKGLSLARGKYVCYVDADDKIHPEYLSKMYEAAEAFEADMVITNFCKFGDDTKPDTSLNVDCGILTKETILRQIARIGNCHTTEVMVVAWNKLIRTDIARKIAFKENVYHEDEFYINMLITNCQKICLIQDVLYYYRQRPGSIMKSLNNDNFKKYVAVLEAYEQRIYMCRELGLDSLKKMMASSYCLNMVIQYKMIPPEYRDADVSHFFSNQALKAWLRYGIYMGKKRCIKWILFILHPEYYIKRYDL